MSHVAWHMSYVKCLCWSLGHAEQLLFSSLGSKVTIYCRKLQWLFFDIIIISSSSSTLSCEFTDHRAGSQLKIIYSCAHLSIWGHMSHESSKITNLLQPIKSCKKPLLRTPAPAVYTATRYLRVFHRYPPDGARHKKPTLQQFSPLQPR